MKGKTKTQKGITLVALIITIVVLLILAVVAINSIQEDKIIQHANDVSSKYNQAQVNEQTTINGYLDYIDNSMTKYVKPKVGQYIEYEVSYDDIYNSTSTELKTFGKTDGWRYLGTEEGTGNHLLISTGVPMIMFLRQNEVTDSKDWWDTTQTSTQDKIVQGMLKNLKKIPYKKVNAGTVDVSSGTMIGLFDGTTMTNESGTEYIGVGEYFSAKNQTYSSKILNIRTLTLAELNRAVNSANSGIEGYTQRAEDSKELGFKDIPEGNQARGLFDLSQVSDLQNNYTYWLATTFNKFPVGYVYCNVTYYDSEIKSGYGSDQGIRPVVVLSSTCGFIDENEDGILEIK